MFTQSRFVNTLFTRVMPRLSFKEATDVLGLSAVELERELGVSAQSIRQARLAEGKSGSRPAPSGWEATIARLARKRASELKKMADRLNQGGG